MNRKNLLAPAILSVMVLVVSFVPNAPTPGRTAKTGDPAGPVRTNLSPHIRVVETYGKLPLSFEANTGENDPHVKFLSRGRGYTLFLTGKEAVLALQSRQWSVVSRQLPQTTDYASRTTEELALLPNPESLIPSPSRTPNPEPPTPAVLRMNLVGANPSPEVSGLDELPGKSNYFLGNDPKKWRTNVPTYAKVKYQRIYPGVDLVYYGNQRQLEYDFFIMPGADPEAITLAVEAGLPRLDQSGGVKPPLQIDANGDLVFYYPAGEVRFHKPVVYQASSDPEFRSPSAEKHFLDGRYVLRASKSDYRHSEIENSKYQVGFEVAAYDQTRPLVIDPVLSYSTYLGGSDTDWGQGIAVDTSGNAYVTGFTDSLNFPRMAPLQNTSGGSRDVFVTRLNSTGTALVYSTYLGGSGFDEGFGVAVDSSGNAYVTGLTASPNFPTTPGAYQTTPGGGSCNGFACADAFVTKLNAQGSALVFSTYLGGSGDDEAFGIAVDTSGNAYVTGQTASSNFPTKVPLQPACNTCSLFSPDAFVTKLNAAGSGLIYSTYLGGNLSDSGQGIAVDASGNAYITGRTSSSNFPTASPFQGTFGGGSSDAFVTKLGTAGNLIYSSFLGGIDFESGNGIAVDSAGNAYVTGATRSFNFPTVNALQPSFITSFQDGFVTKVNAAGTNLTYSTFLGGSGSLNDGAAIAVDSSGNAYVTGGTDSADFPTANAVQANCSSVAGVCSIDAFVTKLNAAGTGLIYSTYLGGSTQDQGLGIAVDSAGGAYIAGQTGSSDFPTGNPLQPAFGGGSSDAFVAKLSGNLPPVAKAGPDQTVECSAHNGTSVTLNGLASSDSDGDLLTYKWTDIQGHTVGNTAVVTVTLFQLGSYTFTLTVDDGQGATASAATHVTLRDTTPPVLSFSTNRVIKVLPTATATGAAVNLSGIASATDICDPSPVITNNAPKFFPIGSTTVIFTATDASGNSSHKNLTVHVVYNFIGFLSPIDNNGTSVFNSGKTIPVKFQLTAADGSFVTNAKATLQAFLIGSGGELQLMPVSSSGGSNVGNLFRFDSQTKQYNYNLSTTGYGSGTYLLRALVNDQTKHGVVVSVQ